MTEDRPPAEGHAQFATTCWSLVRAAGSPLTQDRLEALESLFRAYWHPLYAYIRRAGHNPDDAKDLTQSFLARLVEKDLVGVADRARGRFRTFLLTALKNYLVDDARR